MANRFLNNIRINDAYTFPASDGTNGQVITTDGSGNLTFADQTGGVSTSALSLNVTVKNVSGGSLYKGTIVHAAPTATPPSGNVIEVIAADYDTSTDMPAIAVLNETIANEAEGEAIMFGAVSGIDTSSFGIGDELWVGNNGAFTNTKPATAGQLIQKIAVVIKSHASNGLIKVFGAGRTNDVPLPLYIDNTNQRVGIGTNSPSYKLDVSASGVGGIRSVTNVSGWAGWFENTGSSSGIVITAGVDSGDAPLLVRTQNGTEIFSVRGNGTSWFAGSGNVGIGTSSPTHKVEILGGNAATLLLNNDGSQYTQLLFENNGSSNSGADFLLDHTNSLFKHRSLRGGQAITFETAVTSGTAIERMRIDSSGNVGIGTTPGSGYKLDVAGSIRTNSNLVANNVYSGSGTFVFGLSTSLGEYITSVGNDIRFHAGGSAVATIDGDNSRFGIGTTSPNEKLEVAGSVRVGNLKIQNANGGRIGFNRNTATGAIYDSSYGAYQLQHNFAGYLELQSYNSAGSLQSNLVFTESGNLGIGTTSPTSVLDIKNDTTNTYTLRFKASDDGHMGGVYQDGGNNAELYLANGSSTNTILINSSGDSYFNGGNVGIGTNSPNYKLEVYDGDIGATNLYLKSITNSNVRLQGVTSGDLDIYNNLTHRAKFSSTGDFWLYGNNNIKFSATGDATIGNYAGTGTLSFRTAAVQRVFIDSSGNVGIGNSSPAEKLDVSGKIEADNAFIVRGIDTTNSQPSSNDAFISGYGIIGNRGTFYVTNGGGAVQIGRGATHNASPTATFASNGNVGINTVSPDVKLKVIDASPTDGIVANFMNSTNSGGTTAAIQLSNATNNACDVVLGANRVGANFGSDFFISLSDSVDGTNQERFRITEAGNVGIGTTSPSYELDVAGAIGLSGRLHIDTNSDEFKIGSDDYESGQPGVMVRPADNANPADADTLFVVRSGGGSPRLFVEHSGITGTSNSIFTVGAGSSRTTGNVVIQSNAVSYFNGGNVGIGTTTPGATLDVNGAIVSRGGTYDAGTDTRTNAGLVIQKEDYIHTQDGSYLRNLIGKSSTNVIEIGQGGTSLVSSINLLPGTGGNSAVNINGNTVWNAGNDGAGSGLDADLLDGVQASSFLRSDANDTLTSTLKVTGSIIHEYNSLGGYIARPKGAQYTTNSNAHTGAIKIKLPTNGAADMLSFWVDIFDYSTAESFSVFVAGYLYQTQNNNEWVNVSCFLLTENGAKHPVNIRFGADSTSNCVWIGETSTTWSYPQVVVRDFQVGYTADIDSYDDDWSISFVTAFDAVDETVAAYGPVTQWSKIEGAPSFLLTTGKAADSELIDGIDSSRIVFGQNANKTTNVSDVNTALASGFYDGNSATGSPTSTWYTYINARHNNVSNNYGSQIACSFYDTQNFYVRSVANGTYTAWAKIWNSSNDGSGSGLDADTVDGIQGTDLVRKNTGYVWTGTGGSALSFRSLDTIDTASGDQAALEVYQDTAGADAFMQFHVAGDYAKYFGLHGGINDFVVGGWSHGSSYQRIFHDGYHPNADKWTTARTLTLTGDVTGSASFDGSGNITLSTTASGGGGGATSLDGLSDVTVNTTSSNLWMVNTEPASYAGLRNIAIGEGANDGIVDSDDIVVIGYRAGYSGAIGGDSIVIGNQASRYGSGIRSVIIGDRAGYTASTSAQRVLIGANAGYSSTSISAVGIGYYALQNASGTGNVGVGYYAGASDSVGAWNTFVGYQAGRYAGSNSNSNTVVGSNAGEYMGYDNTGTYRNVLVGESAAAGYVTTGYKHLGSDNVIIGASALEYGNENVDQCVYIGSKAGGAGSSSADRGSGENCIVIGYQAQSTSTTVTNEITLGNSSISTLRCQVTSITSLSDKRDKSNIQDSNYGLNIIEKLRPVTFEWNQRDGKRVGVKEVGFIAQELQQVDDDYLGLVYDENPEKLEAAQGKLIPVLVKSIQELKAEIESLKEEINTLKS
jgi:hypothetical protein